MTPPANSARASAEARASLDLDLVLADLSRLDHVRGGLVVAPDGRVLAIRLPHEIPVEPLAALATTLGRDLELRNAGVRRNTFLMAHVAAGEGTMFLCDTPVGLIVLLGEDEVNRETVRHALRAAMETVRQACA